MEQPPDSLTVDHYRPGAITDNEMTRARLSQTPIPFIRPATSDEIADHREALRALKNKQITDKDRCSD